MRRPHLDAEAFYAAIAILGCGVAAAACAAPAPTSSPPSPPRPEPMVPSPSSTSAPSSPSDELAKDDAQSKTSAAPGGPVDAGVELKNRPPITPKTPKPGGSATCAASGGPPDGKGR